MSKHEHIFIGKIPGIKDALGKPYETRWKTYLNGAKYECEINGGKTKYFFIEERKYIVNMPNKPNTPGRIVRIHHFNRDNFDGAETVNEQLTLNE